MAKINVSLPDGLLEEVDRRAEADGESRSAFIREATAHYLTSLDERAEAAARAERIGRAVRKMRSLAPSVGAPDSARVIREVRDAPARWEQR